MSAYKELEAIFTKLGHLGHIDAFMNWDEAVMMPSGGGESRGSAMATLRGIEHELLIHPKNKELIEQAKNESDLNPWEKANLFWMEKHIQEQTCLPIELVKAITEHSIKSEQAWRRYRPENNWQDFSPYLEKIFDLVKEAATIRAENSGHSPYDVLIDDYSPGLTQAKIDPVFSRLKTELPPLIDFIIEKQSQQSALKPEGPFDIAQQKSLGMELMTAIGFDFNHGRLDTSTHPFCGGVPEDVRITTRYTEEDCSSALMGICHETGHALYEQHLPKDWKDQPVGNALGMTVHESQSLIIEMQACRSHEYLHFLSKKLQDYFGKRVAFDPDNLFKLYTKVSRSLIRVDADEVTYPLHVILRYDIEKDLLEGNLRVSDLPEIWNAKMSDYLGISTQGNDKDGVMQDVHWPSGTFGYFPAYTLGRLMAAQLFASAEKKHPTITADLSDGNFTKLTTWLHEHVHQFGSSVDNDTLLKNATGETLNPDYFIQHVKQRYRLSN